MITTSNQNYTLTEINKTWKLLMASQWLSYNHYLGTPHAVSTITWSAEKGPISQRYWDKYISFVDFCNPESQTISNISRLYKSYLWSNWILAVIPYSNILLTLTENMHKSKLIRFFLPLIFKLISLFWDNKHQMANSFQGEERERITS